MKYRMTPNVAVRTDRFSEALRFYSDVLGFVNRSSDTALGDHDASPLNLFVIELASSSISGRHHKQSRVRSDSQLGIQCG